MAQDPTSRFPVMPIKHWWNLRNKFKKSIPGTITTNYISLVLRMTEQSASSNVIPSLRMVGIIDDKGKVVHDAARRFRDDQQYADFCAETLKRIYPQDLRDAFPDANSDAKNVDNWFANHTGVGAVAARRMRAFYLLLCDADPAKEKASDGTSTKAAKASPANKGAAKAKVSSRISKPRVPVQREEKGQGADSPALHINIQVHISSDAAPDQIDQIFKSMAKHIYRVEKDAQ